MRSRAQLVLFAIGAAWMTTACGGSADSTNCPASPSGCPTPAPSYAADIAPIIQQRCVPCHSATGVEPSKPYGSYAQVRKVQMDILFQVRGCKMPPADAPPLTDQEKAKLIGWLYCDGPNN